MRDLVTTAWCGPAIADPPDPRPRWRRWLARLRQGPYERSRVTLHGYLLIGLLLALGGAAYNSGNNLLFLALSFLLACLLLNGLLAWANFGGLAWRLHGPLRIRAGDTARLELELFNHRRWIPASALQLEFAIEGGLGRQTRRLAVPGSVPPRGAARVSLVLPPQTRGRVIVRLHRVGSAFPFGFIRKGVVGESTLHLIVRPASLVPQVSPIPAFSQGGDRRSSRQAGSQGDLRGLRNYRRGDSPRAVHWKASARAGRLLIREVAQEQTPRLALRLSLDRQQWPDAVHFEKMVSLAATLTERWSRQGLLAAVSWEGFTQAVSHPHDLDTVLDALAVVSTCGPDAAPVPSLRSVAIAQLRPLPRGRAGVFLHEHLIALAVR